MVLRHTRHKIGHLGDVRFPQPISWLSTEMVLINVLLLMILQSLSNLKINSNKIVGFILMILLYLTAGHFCIFHFSAHKHIILKCNVWLSFQRLRCFLRG